MRWIICRRVRLALITTPRLASGTSMPSSSTRGAATASSLRTRRSSRISRRCPRAVEPVISSTETSGSSRLIGVVRRAHRLGEHERALRVLDRRGEAAQQLVLPDRLGDDLAPLGERIEVVARRPTVGARVSLRQVRDRGEEVAEGFERHVADAAQMLPRARRAAARSRRTPHVLRPRAARRRTRRAGGRTRRRRSPARIRIGSRCRRRTAAAGR